MSNAKTGICPKCGYRGIKIEEHVISDGKDRYTFYCPLCNGRFIEFYRHEDGKFTMRLSCSSVKLT